MDKGCLYQYLKYILGILFILAVRFVVIGKPNIIEHSGWLALLVPIVFFIWLSVMAFAFCVFHMSTTVLLLAILPKCMNETVVSIFTYLCVLMLGLAIAFGVFPSGTCGDYNRDAEDYYYYKIP